MYKLNFFSFVFTITIKQMRISGCKEGTVIVFCCRVPRQRTMDRLITAFLCQSAMNLSTELTVKCLLAAPCFPTECVQARPAFAMKALPLFYSRFESFLHGNRPRQQSLVTLLGPQATLQERTATAQHRSRLIHCYSDKRHYWDPCKDTVQNDTVWKRPHKSRFRFSLYL